MASNWFVRHPEMGPLVVAYRNAMENSKFSGAAERHAQDVIATGRQAIRDRDGK
jgi:hypothetical protein